MSKGLGKSYVQRMKRFHVPYGLDPKKRIEAVVDRAWYHDGAFKYKLPRYFRDRLFRKQFPCEQKVWNPKSKCYETKIVKRYKSQNYLALQMQTEIRTRVLDEYNRRIQEVRSEQNLDYTEAARVLERSERAAREARLQDIFAKMSRFYNYNRFKNKRF